MRKQVSVFITHTVVLTGIDKATSVFNNDVFERLCFQIKPYYLPSEKWMITFKKRFDLAESYFSITEMGICYLTIEKIKLKMSEVQGLVIRLNEVITQVNNSFDNDGIIGAVNVENTGLVLNPDISKFLDSIN